MSTLLVDDEHDIRRISFNRPEQLNALHRDDVRAATDAVNGLPPTAEALVFTGAGERAFSGGVHIDSFAGLGPSTAHQLITELAALLAAVRRAAVPTVAVVRGYCIGGAFELALACDLRIAADDASFGLPEIKVGIPSVIDAALLPQYVGLALAKEMILTGNLYGAAEMERRGLLNVMTSPEGLDAAAEAMLERVSGHSRTAMAAQKRLFELWQNVGLGEGIDGSIEEFAAVFAGQETADRVDAYRRQRAQRHKH